MFKLYKPIWEGYKNIIKKSFSVSTLQDPTSVYKLYKWKIDCKGLSFQTSFLYVQVLQENLEKLGKYLEGIFCKFS